MKEDKDRNMAVRPEDEAVFEDGYLLNKMGGDQENLKRILDYFKQDTRELFSSLEESLLAGDQKMAEKHAHTIKGSAANVGARALSSAALEVERTAREGRMELAEKRFERMKRELERLNQLLWRDED